MPKKSELIWKFEYDMRTKSRMKRLLIAIDQFFNVLVWNGSQDETISSHIGRKIENGTANGAEKIICRMLRVLQSEHCKRSLGE